MKNIPHLQQALRFAQLCALVILFTCPRLVQAANETVTVDITGGGGFTPFFANPAGTAQNGWTVRLGAFTGANQTTVEALGYNLLWVNNQFTLFGSNVTETINSQAGSFDPSPNLTNTSDALKGQKAWLVYSDTATLGSAASFGVVSSNSSDWTIPNASPWVTQIDTSEINITAFGSSSGTGSSDSIRTATKPADFLYWDSNASAGTGGSGTWSSSIADTEWTTSSGGLAGDGTYAWGTTSGTDYYAGAGLTANFGGDAGTVTVSGTVETRHGIRVEAAYTITSGTVNLAGGNSTANGLEVTSGNSATIASTLTGSNGFTKSGAGNLTLSGSNSLSGAVQVTGGQLEVSHANALGTTSSVAVTGGSLLVTADDAIDGKNITLNSTATGDASAASLAFSGTYNGTVGALTLSRDSIIDLGTGSVIVHFSSLLMGAYNLAIYNWTGTTLWNGGTGNNTDQFYVDSALGTGELSRISFYSGIGSNSFMGTGYQLSGGSFNRQIIPVPEPSAYLAAALILGACAVQWFKKKAPRRDGPTARLEAPAIY